MTDYTKITDFAAKDALPSGNASKIATGTEIDDELDAIAVAIATKYDSTDRGVNNGIAALDSNGDVPAAQLPAASTTAQGAAELATSAEAITGTDTGRVVTPSALQAVLDQNAGVLNDISGLSDPGGDRIGFWDDSASTFTWLTAGTNLSISGTTISAPTATLESSINHDNLTGFVGNEHINHTSVTLTAGVGLSGGGDISTNRSFALDISTGELSAITASGLSQSQDGFLVDNNGTPNRMAYSAGGVIVNTVTGTSDTLATSDINTFIEYTNGSAVTVTLNNGVGATGNFIIIKQSGGGQVTINGTATVETAVGQSTRTQHSVIVLVCIASNTWALYGDTA